MNHKKASKAHFKKRFKERVGYSISDNEVTYIKDNILKTGKHIKTGQNGSVYLFTFNKINLKLVYNPFSNMLITVLPL